MPSVLAIVSKAVFEKLAKAAGGAELGAVLGIDRYASTHASLEPLAEGGALFLVTVRPPDEALWLVAVLEAPERRADGWFAAPSTIAIADVSKLKGTLRFASGTGITAKPGALGMSLQTPRALTDEDVALLRRAAGGKATQAKGAKAKPAAAKPAPAKAAKAKATSAAPAKAKATAAKAKAKAAPAAPAKAKATAAKATAAGAGAGKATTAGAPSLDAISTALQAGDGAAALEAALVAWRASRALALADLIDAISAAISPPAITDETAWSAAAGSKDPALLGALLPAITGGLQASFLPTAAELLAAWPDDPRLANAAAAWVLEPPTTSSSNYPFWTRTLDAVARIGDARVVAPLRKRLKQPVPNRQGGGTKPSQFWGKFYPAIEKTLAKLADRPAPGKVDDKAVAKLAKRAAALEPAELEATPRAPVTAPRAPAPKLSGPPLAQALAHLEADRVLEAIDVLVAAWRDVRDPAVADLVDRASRLLPAYDQALPVEPAAADAAWQAAFAADPGAALPMLLHHVDAGGAKLAEKRLVALSTLPDDPRVALALATLACTTETSPERTQYWKTLWGIVAKLRDVRVCGPLRTYFADFAGTYYDHHRQGRRIVGDFVLAPGEAPSIGADRRPLEQLAAALARREAAHAAEERALIAAIVKDWADDGPRLVYADWLIEREHPRGELIVLACKKARGDTLTAAEGKRLGALQGGFRNPTYLHGPLTSLLGALDRGLPSRLDIDFRATTMQFWNLPGYPLLACVETLDFANAQAARGVIEAADLARVLMDPTAVRLTRCTKLPDDDRGRLMTDVLPLVKGRWKRAGADLVRA